jgi:hypothetical protein
MRAFPALLSVLLATVVVTACSGPGPAVSGRTRTTLLASPHTVGCDQIIQQVNSPDGRLVLGVLAAPPAHIERAASTATRPWSYFAKYGIEIRADSPDVLITVPEAWRQRAAIGWGNNIGTVSSLRLASCPRQLGEWNVYAGGFYLRSASGCVPLIIHIRRQTTTLSFAIGNGSCGSGT